MKYLSANKPKQAAIPVGKTSTMCKIRNEAFSNKFYILDGEYPWGHLIHQQRHRLSGLTTCNVYGELIMFYVHFQDKSKFRRLQVKETSRCVQKTVFFICHYQIYGVFSFFSQFVIAFEKKSIALRRFSLSTWTEYLETLNNCVNLIG